MGGDPIRTHLGKSVPNTFTTLLGVKGDRNSKRTNSCEGTHPLKGILARNREVTYKDEEGSSTAIHLIF